MTKIPFSQKLITCLLAGLVVGAFLFRQGVTFFRQWIPMPVMSMLELLIIAAAIVYAFIWQARKTNKPGTLAFWQALIRYGVAYDLASFGWEKIGHLQLVIPLSWLDRPYSSFSPSELFWAFFAQSYLFACIIAAVQIVGALLLLFRRTRLTGVFILIPVLANILLMDIFYQIGPSVVVHASIMMAGTLYFLFIEFDRLKAFFFAAKDRLPSLPMSPYGKIALRLSIIYIPLILIALHGPVDKHPQLTGKYAATPTHPTEHALSTVYFDIKDGCVFEFGTPFTRWSGRYSLDNDSLDIVWRTPLGKPEFKGRLTRGPGENALLIRGSSGLDSIDIKLQRVTK